MSTPALSGPGRSCRLTRCCRASSFHAAPLSSLRRYCARQRSALAAPPRAVAELAALTDLGTVGTAASATVQAAVEAAPSVAPQAAAAAAVAAAAAASTLSGGTPLADVAAAAAAASSSIQAVTDGLVAVLPAAVAPALGPAVTTLGGDLAGLVALHPSMEGSLRLLAIYYALLARPGPVVGLLDFYVLGPLSKVLQPQYGVEDFTLRDRLGSGNYGQVYEGLRNGKDGLPDQYARQLTPEQKKRRVVLKKVNMDNSGIRTNFLAVGTMARGAGESGQVESYMCSRIRNHPLVKPWAAEYLGQFVAEGSARGFTTGSQWLVWKFESDSTLADAMNGALGPFPGALADIMLGERTAARFAPANEADEKRDALVVKAIMKRLLTGMERLHSLGIVHRDIKPDNIMVTAEGEVKIIDFGAACDLSTGINYNPLFGMLDPRYAAPEELVMPKNVPRAPLPVVASLFAPFVWQYGRPDLFDTYAAGIILMQLSVPQLSNAMGLRTFNLELANAEYDLVRWRETSSRARQCDFTLLDRNNGAGWDLACKLVCERNSLNRGRLSAVEALRHRYFRPEF